MLNKGGGFGGCAGLSRVVPVVVIVLVVVFSVVVVIVAFRGSSLKQAVHLKAMVLVRGW